MRLSVALCTVPAIAIVCAPVAHAENAALNGTYTAVSNGEWAMTNDVFRDEATTRSIWTIAMTCTDVVTCSGTVTSDAGWTADISTSNGEYVVKREHPNWEPCTDGRFFAGHQRYQFYPADDSGGFQRGSQVFAGRDTTAADSGNCSINEKLEIELPFRLEKLT